MNDKEGRKWLLKKLYDNGIRYIIFGGPIVGYIGTREEPPNIKKEEDFLCRPNDRVNLIQDLLPDFNEPNYLDIGKYLGIVDWSKIPVDTPILVKQSDGGDWEKRHFAFYKNGKVYSWLNGTTSWATERNDYVFSWRYAKLKGGSDEN